MDYRVEPVWAKKEGPNKVKALSVTVYHSNGIDCSLNGISTRFDSLYVIGVEGPYTIDLDNPPENTVWLIKFQRNSGEKPYYHLAPLDAERCGGAVWYSSGGNLAYTCDSRWPLQYGLPIHDRDMRKESKKG